jgi:hypothetical protein
MTDLEWDPRLAAITLAAAVVNGAVGYGFSSITVPVALLFLTNRIINPAMVLVEVPANAYALLLNRRDVSAALPAVTPVAAGLPFGIVLGTLALARVAPAWMKLATFASLLPLILLQGAGWRRPLRSLRIAGPAIGAGVGGLYAVTAISGPPLAVFLTNQGLTRGTFRAGMATLRLIESTLTAVAFAWAGLCTWESASLVPSILPSLMLGFPLGAWVMSRVPADVFRRVCISLDAWLVAFGLTMLLRGIVGLRAPAAYGLLLLVIAVDGLLFWRFATTRDRDSDSLHQSLGFAATPPPREQPSHGQRQSGVDEHHRGR